DGSVFFSESFHGQIRRVDGGTGILTTVAGFLHPELWPCTVGVEAGDGGRALDADLCFPLSLAIDPAHEYLYVDEWTHIFTDLPNTGTVRRISFADGTITTYAGNGVDQFGGDNGPAALAGINGRPGAIAFDPAGNLFIDDESSGIFRRVDSGSGIITTVAGGGFIQGGVVVYSAAEIGGPAL